MGGLYELRTRQEQVLRVNRDHIPGLSPLVGSDALAPGAPSAAAGVKLSLCLGSCVPDMGLTGLGKVVFPASRKAVCSLNSPQSIFCLLYPQVPRIMWYK